MADQQRFVVNKFPLPAGPGTIDTLVRVDTETGKTWILVGHMMIPPESHTYKWQAVEDTDLPQKSSNIPIG